MENQYAFDALPKFKRELNEYEVRVLALTSTDRVLARWVLRSYLQETETEALREIYSSCWGRGFITESQKRARREALPIVTDEKEFADEDEDYLWAKIRREERAAKRRERAAGKKGGI